MELENNEAQSPAVEENAVTAAAKLAAAASAPAPENREVPRWYILQTQSIPLFQAYGDFSGVLPHSDNPDFPAIPDVP